MADDGEAVARYAIDRAGIRRYIAPGDDVPEGWTLEESPEPESEPEPEPPKPTKRSVSKD